MGPDTAVDDSAPAAAPDGPAAADPAGQTCCPSEDRPLSGRRRWGRLVLPVVFFAVLLAHILLLITPQVLYQADEIISKSQATIPVFPYYYQGMSFFKEFVGRPGGLADYAGANVGQYFGIPFGGVVVLTAIALAAFLVTDSLIVLMGGRRRVILPFIPPLLLVVIWNQYAVRLGDLIGILAALLSVCAYLRLPDRAIRRVAFIGLLAAVYYIAGGAFVLTAGLCALYELLIKRRWLLGVGYLLVGAAVPWAMATWLFDAELGQAAGGLTGSAMTGGSTEVTAWVCLHVFYVLLTVAVAFGKPLRRTGERLLAATPLPVAMRRLVGALDVGRPILLILLTAAIAAGTYNLGAGEFRRLSYSAQMEQWPLVLKIARRNPGLITPYICRTVNRALYETGLMGSEMFAFPQIPDGGLLPRMEMDQPYKSDTLLKLGAVNRIEHLALESKEIWGPRPFVIRLLARVALVKGDAPTARIWLNMLAKDIVHQAWATERLRRLSQDPSMRSDEEVAQIRSVMLTGGDLQASNIEQMLVDLLATNPGNRMAFEYLMAHYLLTCNLDRIVANVGQLAGLGYQTVPDHLGEAVLIYQAQTERSVDLNGVALSARTLQRNSKMAELSSTHRGDWAGVVGAMRADPDLDASYFRYYRNTLPMLQAIAHEP